MVIAMGLFCLTGCGGGSDDNNIPPEQWKSTVENGMTVNGTQTTSSGGTASVSSFNKYYAVIVGISDYQEISDLQYAHQDAIELRSTLVQHLNWETANIKLLTNSSATKQNIQNSINQVADQITSNDLFLFYLSGHGGYVIDENGNNVDFDPADETDGRDEFVCTYNSLLDSYDNEILDDEFATWMNAVPTANIVIILDTCYSGGMFKPGMSYEKATITPRLGKANMARTAADGFDFARDALVTGMVAISAAAENELSWDDFIFENGLFSYYILEAFGAEGTNRNSDGYVSAEELFQYAAPKATDRAMALYGAVLTPRIVDTHTGSMPVARIF